MPVSALPAASAARNGVGAFILQCRRLDFHYCDWAGSSRGMNSFLESPLLSSFASRHPSVQIHVSPRPHKHPVIRAHYTKGQPRSICVRNLSKEEVLEKAKLLRDASGAKNRRLRSGRFVTSQNQSVRGIWSAMHAEMMGKRQRTGDNGQGEDLGKSSVWQWSKGRSSVGGRKKGKEAKS